MSKREMIVKSLAYTLIFASLAGCGGGSPAATDEYGDGGYDQGGYDPNAGGQYGGTTGTTPTPMPTPATGGGYSGGTQYGGELTATVIKKKNGSFLGIGKYTCTVEISNPGSTPRSGTLTVTFTNGKKNSATAPITQQVTLQANETRTLDFVDKKWTTDNVTVEITTDAAPSGMAGGAPTTGYSAPLPTGTGTSY